MAALVAESKNETVPVNELSAFAPDQPTEEVVTGAVGKVKLPLANA